MRSRPERNQLFWVLIGQGISDLQGVNFGILPLTDLPVLTALLAQPCGKWSSAREDLTIVHGCYNRWDVNLVPYRLTPVQYTMAKFCVCLIGLQKVCIVAAVAKSNTICNSTSKSSIFQHLLRVARRCITAIWTLQLTDDLPSVDVWINWFIKLISDLRKFNLNLPTFLRIAECELVCVNLSQTTVIKIFLSSMEQCHSMLYSADIRHIALQLCVKLVDVSILILLAVRSIYSNFASQIFTGHDHWRPIRHMPGVISISQLLVF
jgi:hypothetical protein